MCKCCQIAIGFSFVSTGKLWSFFKPSHKGQIQMSRSKLIENGSKGNNCVSLPLVHSERQSRMEVMTNFGMV